MFIRLIVGLVVDIVGLTATALAGWACWNMYIPEAFPGAPPLTFASAIGVACVLSILGPGGKAYGLEDALVPEKAFIDSVINVMMNSVVKPLTLLVMAWAAHALLF